MRKGMISPKMLTAAALMKAQGRQLRKVKGKYVTVTGSKLIGSPKRNR